MGLDMYLNGKRYISKWMRETDEQVAEAIAEQLPELKNRKGRYDDGPPVKEVTIEAGYWRKANAIHRWFVEHVQEGKDNCAAYYVDRDKLIELKETCERVLAFRHLAVELLPPQAGFFFGSTDVDEHYWADLQHTVDIINDCLSLPEFWEFEYQSSW